MTAALPLPYPFDTTFMQLALVAGLAIGVAAPLVGTFLVYRRLALMGDGIGHVAFAGVAAGFLLDVWPVWSALLAATVGAALLEWLRSRRHTSGDLVLALFLYSGVALGVVLTSLSDSFDTRVLGYRFGAILTATPTDAWTTAALGLGVTVLVALTWRAHFSVLVDEDSARVAGLPADALNLVLAVVSAVVVVASMRVVGVLLVAALMALPAGTAQRLVSSFRAALVLGAAVGAVSVVVGLSAAREWDLAPGGAIVLVSAGAFVVSALLPSRLRLGR